jgi:hypothetical protein
MILIWGSKQKKKQSGFVADLCPSCASIQVHRLVELRSAPHLYYASIGPGKVIGYQVECGACNLDTLVDPSRFAARLDQEIPLEKLISLTHPGVHAELEEQKDREERAQRGELSSEERVEVMIEALYPVTSQVEERAGSRAIDGRVGLSALATLILPWGLILPGVADLGPTGDILVWAGVAVGVLGIIATVYASQTSLSRYIRKTQGEGIQAALSPYNPSPADLSAVADGLKNAGTDLGKKVDRAWLQDLFHSMDALAPKPIG